MKRYYFLWLLLLSFSLSSFAQNEAPSPFELGRDAYRKGDYLTAEKYYLQNLSFQDTSAQANERDKIIARLLIGDVYRKQRIFAKAMPFYEEAMRHAEAAKEDNLYLSAAQNRAFLYSKMYEPIRAINEVKRLLPFAEAAFGKESGQVGNLTMNLGIDYFKMGAYYRAEQQFLEALALYPKTAEPNSEQFNRVYSNMGVNYRKMGAYDKAIEYGEKALEIKLLNYPENHPSVSKYHLNIGRVYRDMKKPEKALPYLEKALSIEQMHFPENHPFVTGMKGELANILADLEQYEEALGYYQASQSVDPQYMAPDHPYIIASYANIALVYMEMERFEEALATQEQAISMMENSGYFPPYKQTEMLRLLSEIHDKKGDLNRALALAIEGLEILAIEADADFSAMLPSQRAFDDQKLYIQMMTWIGQLYERKGATAQALDAADKAIEAVHLLRSSYHSDSDRQFLNSSLTELFELAVRTAFTSYEADGDESYLRQAFAFMEAAKADVLKRAVNEGLALRSAEIPEVLLDSLDELSFKIGSLKDDLNDWLMASESDDDSQAPDSLKSNLFEQRESHRALLRHIELSYPAYHQLKFGKGLQKLPQITHRLKQVNGNLLTYFYDDSSLYCILLCQDKIYGFRTAHQDNLAGQISDLRDFLNPEKALNMRQSELKHFQQQCHALHELLLAPALGQAAMQAEQKLIIVPFGLLHYLPFELLHEQTEAGLAFKESPFLIKKYPVTYALSASLWAQERKEVSTPRDGFKGFAPQYDDLPMKTHARLGFGSLHWNVKEVENAQRLLKGTIFVNEAASEEQFRQQAPLADILHLSMHADVNDQLPMRSGLLFTPGADSLEDGFLNLYEIYNLRLPAQTVVLNACNTGYGQLAEGEGVLSLSHAFSYAGCRNILFNLWLADDQASSQIVNAFYQELQAGLSQEEALRQAKLSYLEAADPLRAHPYFWAGLVLQGGMEEPKSGFGWWWGLGIVLVFGLGYFLLRRLKAT